MIEYWHKNKPAFRWLWCAIRRHDVFATQDRRAGCSNCGYKSVRVGDTWVSQ